MRALDDIYTLCIFQALHGRVPSLGFIKKYLESCNLTLSRQNLNTRMDTLMKAGLITRTEELAFSHRASTPRFRVTPNLRYDDLFDLEIKKVRENNKSINNKKQEFLRHIRESCDARNHGVLNETLNSVEFKVWYDSAQTNTAVYKLYTRHDEIHAIWTAKLALEITDVLVKNENLREFFSIERHGGNTRDIKCAILLASLWHDCGNALARENHYIHSCILAKEIVERILKQIYEKSKRNMILSEILRCIYLHEKDAGTCDNLESAIIRVADGADCGVDRVGENGEKPTSELFKKGAALHVKSKISIRNIEISQYQRRVRITALLDPDFSLNSALHPLENLLYEDRIKTLSDDLRELFEIWYEYKGTKKQLV